MTTAARLRADLAFIRVLILMHCRVIDVLKQAERDTMAALDAAQAAESGEVAAAMARAGADMWQWDGRCRN